MFQTKLVSIPDGNGGTIDVPHYQAGQNASYIDDGKASYVYNTTLQTGYEKLESLDVLYSLYIKKWGDLPTKEIATKPDQTEFKRFDFKFVRDYIKELVSAVGFTSLSTSDKIIAAKCNIGTKQEQEAILNANFTVKERQDISYNYDYNVSNSRKVRASEIIGAFWQFTGHLVVPSTPYPIPAYILTQLITINNPNAGEIAGDLMDLFTSKGLQGIQIAQDGILGIYDFILSTQGTRFETMGLDTNLAILGAGIPSGFADWTKFKEYIFDIIHKGNY